VISGELEAVRPSRAHETLITIVRRGQFTGEVNTLSGRRALARIRARQPSEVIELAREEVLDLVQSDGELSQILMRAFILRRAELFTQGIGDATLVGSNHSADTASRSSLPATVTPTRISTLNVMLTWSTCLNIFMFPSPTYLW
jgi:thioredoxin reductase (NADPH)